MNKGRMVNIVLVVAVVALLGILALSVRISPTADSMALLKTTGISCAECRTRIEKALQTKKGVASVEVDAVVGRVAVGYDAKEIKPEELAATVTGVGFPSRVEEIHAIGQHTGIGGGNHGQAFISKAECGCLAGK